jgi:hypothetical protein
MFKHNVLKKSRTAVNRRRKRQMLMYLKTQISQVRSMETGQDITKTDADTT